MLYPPSIIPQEDEEDSVAEYDDDDEQLEIKKSSGRNSTKRGKQNKNSKNREEFNADFTFDYDDEESKQQQRILKNKRRRMEEEEKNDEAVKRFTKPFYESNTRKRPPNSSSQQKLETFDGLNLSRPILKAVFEAGFQQATPIQAACIPVALSGQDICACSATGTGKTAAFMLPILERLLFKPRTQGRSATKVLVLVPTRELAIQVFQVSRRLAKYTNVEMCLAAGGLDKRAQEAALRQGLDVVIATPGRLIDHLHNAPNFSLAEIEVLVLDEADRILEEQFMDQMKEIIKLCARNRQTMLFSATISDEIEELANLSLKNPVKLFINENTDMSLNLHQEFIRIRADQQQQEDSKDEEDKKREAIVAALVTQTFADRCIIFIRTKRDCQRMQIFLRLLGVKVGQLHGSLTQAERIETLAAFRRQKEVKVLCATDLAARGLDVEEITTVINLNMPSTLKQYIHRVGRTARAGKAGRSISLVGEEERKLMREILKAAKKSGAPSPLKRTIAPETIDQFLKKKAELELSITKALEEEKFEREFQKAEKTLKKAEKGIKILDEQPKRPMQKRVGFKADRKAGKAILAANKRKRMSKGRRREEKKQHKMGNRKEKDDGGGKMMKGGKEKDRKSKKTSFTQEIANTSTKAIKRFRYGPDDFDFKKAKRRHAEEMGGGKRK